MFSLSIWILGIAALFCLALHKFIIHPTFLSPLAKVPNAHWSSPFSPAWILWTRYSNRENKSVHAAHLKHGPVVRLAPNELSVNNLAGVKTVYIGGFEKGEWYSIFNNYGGSVLCLLILLHDSNLLAAYHAYSQVSIHDHMPLESGCSQTSTQNRASTIPLHLLHRVEPFSMIDFFLCLPLHLFSRLIPMVSMHTRFGMLPPWIS